MSSSTSCLRWANVSWSKVGCSRRQKHSKHWANRGRAQGGFRPPAKGLQALGQGGGIHLLLRLSLELAQLLGQAMLRVRHLLSFALELVTPHELRQIYL